MKVKLKILTCERCGHRWTPRKPVVRQCPNQKCRSAYWNVPREKDESRNDEKEVK
jgi:hypothetical protein